VADRTQGGAAVPVHLAEAARVPPIPEPRGDKATLAVG
jgi:hypothetical protein